MNTGSPTVIAATPPSGAPSTGTGSGTAGSGDIGETSEIVTAVLTPVLASASTEPVPVTGTDGKTYLVYELYLTNTMSAPVTIESVQALNSDSGAVLQSRSGADLVAHTRVIGQAAAGAAPPSSVRLGGGQLAIVWVDPSVEGAATMPTSVEHQVKVSYESAPNPLFPAKLTETVAATTVRSLPAPTIASPLNGDNWLNANGCCDEVTPHRGAASPLNGHYFFPERFAVDWVQLDDERRLLTGPSNRLSSYPFYGAPVHAVSDGTIIAVSDQMQDEIPGANPPVGSLTLGEYGGNYVVERFAQGGQNYYAFYAHLKPGSAKARVRVGQSVQSGDQVGELGNSGNTSAPHLHFHVMDAPDPLASNGLPFQFDSLRLVGQAVDDGGDAGSAGRSITLVPDGHAGSRRDTMPLYRDLVDLTVVTSAGAAPTSPTGTATSGR